MNFKSPPPTAGDDGNDPLAVNAVTTFHIVVRATGAGTPLNLSYNTIV